MTPGTSNLIPMPFSSLETTWALYTGADLPAMTFLTVTPISVPGSGMSEPLFRISAPPSLVLTVCVIICPPLGNIITTSMATSRRGYLRLSLIPKDISLPLAVNLMLVYLSLIIFYFVIFIFLCRYFYTIKKSNKPLNLHEYQAKALMAEYNIPVPTGRTVLAKSEVSDAINALGGDRWVVKAQVHAGGRGKAGGVKLVKDKASAEHVVEELLGSRLITHQSGADGQPIESLLIEPASNISRELYLACLVDRDQERIVMVASSEGGMDIEQVAATQPEKILTVAIDPAAGLQGYQCREIAFSLGLEGKQIGELTRIMQSLHRLFVEKDLGLVEINPLVVTGDGTLLAVDAKINVDDSALYRQSSIEKLRDPAQEDPREYKAQSFGLNYVALDGNIGCMVNGAGLAMATMDLVKLHGGLPANFLDVGGGTTADRVSEALKIILSDKKVKAVLVNIFGGIVRCDLIAEGIIAALKEIATSVPMVVRLEGTNVKKGRELLEKSGLEITASTDLTEAAKKVVALAAK